MSAVVAAPRRPFRVSFNTDLRHSRGPADAVDEGRQWAAAWQRVLASAPQGGLGPPGSFDQFDRTVRTMLNRISQENASRLLPLDPRLRSACKGGCDAADSPSWWASRFAALMLATYMQAVHTNRYARTLATRAADNVLPAYLDAIAPLLARSPRLVDAITTWMASLLRLHDLYWPTARLVLLAAQENSDRVELEPRSLGNLPPELLKGRILEFLVPPAMLTPDSLASGQSFIPTLGCWNSEDGRKDAVAVFAHLLLFAPVASWPQLSAFAFLVTEAALSKGEKHERDLFLGASVVSAVAHRLKVGDVRGNAEANSASRPPGSGGGSHLELQALARLCGLLQTRLENTCAGHKTSASERRPKVSTFVRSHALAAVDRATQVIPADL